MRLVEALRERSFSVGRLWRRSTLTATARLPRGLRDPADDRAAKVRRAKADGHTEGRNAEQPGRVDRLIAERPDPRRGYGPGGACHPPALAPLGGGVT